MVAWDLYELRPPSYRAIRYTESNYEDVCDFLGVGQSGGVTTIEIEQNREVVFKIQGNLSIQTLKRGQYVVYGPSFGAFADYEVLSSNEFNRKFHPQPQEWA